MGQRAAALAAQFERAIAEFIGVVEGVSEEQWRAPCPGEGRSVGVLACHVAEGIALEMGFLREFVAGRQPATMTLAEVDAMNAADAAAWAGRPKAATLALLRGHARAAAAEIRRWDDAALARRGRCIAEIPEPWAVGDWLERALIPHVADHLRSVRAALGGGTPA